MMKPKIGLSYFAYGDRSNISKIDTHSSQSAKANSLNIIERNYLSFSKPNQRYKPEYKQYKQLSDLDRNLNDYLQPIEQYKFNENTLCKSAQLNVNQNYHKDKGLYGLQKAKKFVMDSRPIFSPLPTEENELNLSTGSPIVLKEKINENILHPNILHLSSSTKKQRRICPPSINPNFEVVKSGSFLESRDSPEYLRQYDQEKLNEIDNYYIKRNQNVSVLSRFGDWITLPPGSKDRMHPLEKIKHGTYETSIVAPEWMDIHIKNKELLKKIKEQNAFKSYQWKNTCKDNTKVTMLIDRDQKHALPLYLRDSYENYNTEI